MVLFVFISFALEAIQTVFFVFIRVNVSIINLSLPPSLEIVCPPSFPVCQWCVFVMFLPFLEVRFLVFPTLELISRDE